MPKGDKIAIKTVSKPAEESAESLTNWFFDSFDLSGKGDDQEREMFREIVSNSIKGVGITSKEISKLQKLPRSTAIYDLNKFIDSGLVVRKGRKYYLRASDFESTIQELQAEMLAEFNRMMQFASRLDQLMEGEIHDKREKRSRK